MKFLFVTAIVLCFTSATAFAQHDHNARGTENKTSQQTISANTQKQLSQLLYSYYNIKNALVIGDENTAASNAEEFVRTVNSIDYKIISEGNIHLLATDAGKISESKELKKQREHFANFSSNMAAVAKALKLSNEPIYLQYCPMKKASWLSAEKTIRNPYYGSSMLTCGKVTETL